MPSLFLSPFPRLLFLSRLRPVHNHPPLHRHKTMSTDDLDRPPSTCASSATPPPGLRGADGDRAQNSVAEESAYRTAHFHPGLWSGILGTAYNPLQQNRPEVSDGPAMKVGDLKSQMLALE